MCVNAEHCGASLRVPVEYGEQKGGQHSSAVVSVSSVIWNPSLLCWRCSQGWLLAHMKGPVLCSSIHGAGFGKQWLLTVLANILVRCSGLSQGVTHRCKFYTLILSFGKQWLLKVLANISVRCSSLSQGVTDRWEFYILILSVSLPPRHVNGTPLFACPQGCKPAHRKFCSLISWTVHLGGEWVDVNHPSSTWLHWWRRWQPAHSELPYVAGMSEEIRCICRCFNLRVVFWSGFTLHSLLTRAKDTTSG